MTRMFRIAAVALALLGSGAAARAQHADAPLESLVRAGTLRAAVFPPQYTKDQATHAVRGWPVELADALATRLKIEAATVEYPGPREAMEGLKAGLCDLAFLPIEPSWAGDVAFSAPFMQIDFTLLVAPNSASRTLTELDRAGARIAVVNKHASTLALARIVKHATLVGADSPAAAFELVRSGQAEALASVRPALLEFSARLPASAVLEERYGANFLTVAVAKNRAGLLADFNPFIEDAKASGLVQAAIDHAGWRGVQVARKATGN